MATIASQASGNWSDPATWSGGILPGVDDTAQAVTGHVVTIDQDIAVQRLSQTGNGKFVVTGSATRSIDCSIGLSLSATATGTALLEFDDSYSGVGSTVATGNTSVGNHTGSAATSIILIGSGATGSITFTGTSWSGDTSTTGVEPAVLYSTGATDITINITGDLGGSVSTSSYGFYSSSTATGSIDITATSLLNYGLFIGGDKPVTVNANVSARGISATGFTNTLTINGNVSATPGGGGQTGQDGMVITGGSPTIIINGDVTGGTSGTNAGRSGISLTSTTGHDITINGSVSGATIFSGTAGNTGINFSSGYGNLVITGNVSAGNATASNGANISSTNGPSTVTIQGDVIGLSSGSNSNDGLSITGQSSVNNISVTVQGNVTGGVAVNAQGIVVNSYAYLTVEGSTITAGSSTALSSAITSSNLSSTQTNAIRIGKSGQRTVLHNYLLSPAVKLPFMIVDGAEVVSHFYATESITGASYEPSPPLTNALSGIDPADVRYGVSYDDGAETGTMHIPAPENVYLGVPVDDTVGEASINLADAAATTGSQISSLSQ